jgi:DNA-binding NarL/FixJ family response regulator
MKIIICDDQEIVTEGLYRILTSDPDLEVTAIAFNGADALLKIEENQPDLVLMDLKMPVMNGVVTTRKIKEKYPGIHVLILTTYDDDEWVFDAIRSGADGYLLKDTPPNELISAMKGTIQGKSYIDPSIGPKVLSQISLDKVKEHPPSTFNLSDRELEILNLIAQGLTNADISQKLYLTEGTVRNYTSEIFKKLSVSDRTQAAVTAIRFGLVDINDY